MQYSESEMLDYLIEHCVDGVYAADPCNPPDDHPMRWVAAVLAEWCNQNGVAPPNWQPEKEIDGFPGDT